MEVATIVVTRPMKSGDPTSYTYEWGEKAIKMMRDYGYNVIDIQKSSATYNNVTEVLREYKPRLYMHLGHGCTTSLQGQNECIVTRKFGLDELLGMDNFREIMMPLRYLSGCKYTCKLDGDICSPLCTNDSNVGALKGTIVFTVACYSAAQLGKCAIKYGADAYIGYSDLMLFPVDDSHSEDMFRDVHLVFLKSLLEGHTVEEAEKKMNKYEDVLIKMNKKTKFIALPLLWNKINRKVLGNKGVSIYGK